MLYISNTMRIDPAGRRDFFRRKESQPYLRHLIEEGRGLG